MSKKSIVGDSKTAAASYFANPISEVSPVPEPKLDTQSNTQNDVPQNQNAIEHFPDAQESSAPSASSDDSINSVFSIKLNKKKKRDKAVSVRVNSEEYQKFTNIVAALDLNTNDIINQLINEFVRTNSQK